MPHCEYIIDMHIMYTVPVRVNDSEHESHQFTRLGSRPLSCVVRLRRSVQPSPALWTRFTILRRTFRRRYPGVNSGWLRSRSSGLHCSPRLVSQSRLLPCLGTDVIHRRFPEPGSYSGWQSLYQKFQNASYTASGPLNFIPTWYPPVDDVPHEPLYLSSTGSLEAFQLGVQLRKRYGFTPGGNNFTVW